MQYNEETGRYEFDVIEDNNARINVEGESGISYIMLLPNDNKETKIKCKKGDKTYTYTFHNYVKANKVYFRTASDGTTVEPLRWEEIEETPEVPEINGHEYVDLGLSVKWATCNVGATTPEEYGDYYAWGETSPKEEYTEENCSTYGKQMSDIAGNAQYDAATANWGGSWRMPTYDELEELITKCTLTWITQNGVNGYNVEGPNGNSIFLPAAGFRFGSSLIVAGSFGYCWSSSPYEYGDDYACGLDFSSDGHGMGYSNRYYGFSVRPVSGGGFEGPVAQCASVETAEVTEIKATSAVCGGNVTTDGGVEVTARGVCWSTSQNPTIEDNKTTDGSGVGIFTSRLSNLEFNTTYYVRAYATNEVGTSYGEEVSFTTLERTFENGHEYVDLGLPSGLLWATCNVGATSPEEYGNYFAWGETTTKETYTEDNCATYNVSMNDISGNAQYDAATANWGGTWRMPTYDELNELWIKCTWTWITQNGVNGYNVEGPNGNSIFLPAAGYRGGSSLYNAGSFGGYWSSTPYENNDYGAYVLGLYSNGHSTHYTSRYYGQSVRPVLE